LKKSQKQNIAFAVIGAIIIGSVIAYNYYLDQARIKGLNFGNELQEVQEELKRLQVDFESKVTQWKENDFTKEELLDYSTLHIKKMEELVPRYDKLAPPDSFVPSVELFKLSTQSQIESDKEFILWIQTGDESHKVRSDILLQQAFEYELSALNDFNAAKRGVNP